METFVVSLDDIILGKQIITLSALSVVVFLLLGVVYIHVNRK